MNQRPGGYNSVGCFQPKLLADLHGSFQHFGSNRELRKKIESNAKKLLVLQMQVGEAENFDQCYR